MPPDIADPVSHQPQTAGMMVRDVGKYSPTVSGGPQFLHLCRKLIRTYCCFQVDKQGIWTLRCYRESPCGTGSTVQVGRGRSFYVINSMCIPCQYLQMWWVWPHEGRAFLVVTPQLWNRFSRDLGCHLARDLLSTDWRQFYSLKLLISDVQLTPAFAISLILLLTFMVDIAVWLQLSMLLSSSMLIVDIKPSFVGALGAT